MAAAEGWDPYAGMTGLDEPSVHPSEPVTAGLPIGAGPGPEVLASRPRGQVADTLMTLADAVDDPVLRSLASRAQELGR